MNKLGFNPICTYNSSDSILIYLKNANVMVNDKIKLKNNII